MRIRMTAAMIVIRGRLRNRPCLHPRGCKGVRGAQHATHPCIVGHSFSMSRSETIHCIHQKIAEAPSEYEKQSTAFSCASTIQY